MDRGPQARSLWGFSPASARTMLSLALLCTLGSAAESAAQTASDAGLEARGRYRIETGEGTCLRLRPAPGTDNEPLDCIPHGSEVVSFDSQGDWLALRLGDGRTGWSIASALVELSEPAAAPSDAIDAGPTEESSAAPAIPAPSMEPVTMATNDAPGATLPVAAAGVPGGSIDEYAVGAGDLLLVEVFGLNELDRKVRVLRDGTISLPLLGNLPIAGLTVAQAEERIRDLLREKGLVNDPQVSIFLEESVSLSVIVQGAVGKPGVYPLAGRKSLLELIGEAGGLLEGAAERAGNSLYVLRDSEAGRERIDVDLRRLVDEGDISLDALLLPGDIVVVPHARTHQVFVTGTVVKPGPVEFLDSEGITLLQAVTAAGGPTERANLSNLYVLRTLPDGTQERIKANLKKISRGKEPDLVLQKNDVVVMGEWLL